MSLFFARRRGLIWALGLQAGLLAALSSGPSVAGEWRFTEPSASMPAPPEIAARAFVLQDLATHQTLAARNADQRVEPASLTKLMTAYLVFQALRDGKLELKQTLPVSERAWKTGASSATRSFLVRDSRVPVDDLLKGMIVQSGNDATVALAEGVAGSVEAFVERMNRQAQAFGLKNTVFRNPEGLAAPGHVSTARELSIIAAHLVTDFPQSLSYYSLKDFGYNGVKQPSRNLLLWRDPTVDGLQTSFTDSSAYGLVATSRREVAGAPRRLISVLIGATSPESRANESQKLLNWGHGAFDVVKLFDARQTVTTAPVWKGQSADVRLGRTEPLLIVVPRGQGPSLKTTVTRQDPLLAPIAQGQKVATLKITLSGQPWQDVPLTALDAVPSAGWLGRAWDALRLGLK